MNHLSQYRLDDSSESRPASETAVACRSLCAVLREGVDIHRCLAAQALGRIGDPEAVEDLVAALLDQDEDVRIDATRALQRFADPRSATQLFENFLGDPCSDVKLHAIKALTRLRHPELAPWLRRLLKGRDDEIVWDEEEIYADGWDGWIDIQICAIEALAELGDEESVDDIVEVLDDELGQDLTEVGFKALARLGDRGIAALARYLDEPDERRRRRAASVLAGCNAGAAHDAVTQALHDSSENVRLAAARALAARDPDDRRLTLLFDDTSPEVRAEAIRMCGCRHGDSLMACLDDTASSVRCAVCEVVAGAPTLLPAAPVVERAKVWLASSDSEIAAAAAIALAAVDPVLAADDLAKQLADVDRPPAVRLGAIKGLAQIAGEDSVRALADAIGDERRQIRIEAMAALANAATAETDWPNTAGTTLLAALCGELVSQPEPEPETQAEPTPDAAEETILEKPDPGVATPATSTLDEILGDGSGAPRVSLDEQEATELTQEDMAYLALSKRGPRKAHLPVTTQVAPYQDVRRLAARMLGDLAHDDVARALAACLEDGDEDVRRAAADSLARVANRLSALSIEVVESLLAALISSDRDIRLSIVRALGTASDQATCAALINRLRDGDSFVRAEAVHSLSRIGTGNEEVESLLNDPDPGVRSAAARAVAAGRGSEAIGRLVDFAFAFGGVHRRESGRLLRGLDTAAATRRLLDILDDPRQQTSWQVAIESLEEMHRSDIAATDEATPLT